LTLRIRHDARRNGRWGWWRLEGHIHASRAIDEEVGDFRNSFHRVLYLLNLCFNLASRVIHILLGHIAIRPKCQSSLFLRAALTEPIWLAQVKSIWTPRISLIIPIRTRAEPLLAFFTDVLTPRVPLAIALVRDLIADQRYTLCWRVECKRRWLFDVAIAYDLPNASVRFPVVRLAIVVQSVLAHVLFPKTQAVVGRVTLHSKLTNRIVTIAEQATILVHSQVQMHFTFLAILHSPFTVPRALAATIVLAVLDVPGVGHVNGIPINLPMPSGTDDTPKTPKKD
jgi:hypothetical protein